MRQEHSPGGRPPRGQRSRFSKRTKVIAGIAAGVLVVAGTTGAAFGITHSNNAKAYAAAVEQQHQNLSDIATFTAHEPQAAYLYVEGWNASRGTFVKQLETISGAPERLIAEKYMEPVSQALEGLSKSLDKKSDDAPTADDQKLHEQVSKQLKDKGQEFGVDLPAAKSTEGVKVDKELVKKVEEEAAASKAEADAAKAKVDVYEAKLDGLDDQRMLTAKLLVVPSAEALKNEGTFTKSLERASADAKKGLKSKADALQKALDAYKSKEQDAEKGESEKDNDKKAEPTAVERLDFEHVADYSKPALEQANALTEALAEFITSAKSQQESHDSAIAAEAAAQAAAEAEAAGASGYTDPTTGAWVESAGSAGGGGWSGEHSGGGGSGWVDPGNGGGWTSPPTAPPVDNGDGWVGPPPGWTPPTEPTPCPPMPPGWFPTGGTANGCPTFAPPGSGGVDEW